jgi:hypothetical protein
LQQSDLTPEAAANLYGGPKQNPIGSTEADFVRAARAAVDASFDGADVKKPAEIPATPALYGGEKPAVFPEVAFEERFAKLQQGISALSAAGIGSM